MRNLKSLAADRHQLSTATLRNRIIRHGQQVPVYYLHGSVIDGERRLRIAKELGRTPLVQELEDVQDAAQTLITYHPLHAWLEYSQFAGESLREQAEWFDATPGLVSKLRAYAAPSKSESRSRPNYKASYNSLQRYLAQVRQGLVPLTIRLVERHSKLRAIK